MTVSTWTLLLAIGNVLLLVFNVGQLVRGYRGGRRSRRELGISVGLQALAALALLTAGVLTVTS